MIQVTITGRVGKDGVLRDAGSTQVLGFGVACDSGYGSKKTTIWFNCSLFGKRGSSLAQYITKGSQVTVCGEFSEREYEGKMYKEINVSDVALQGGGGNQSSAQEQQEAPVATDSVPF